MVKVDIISGFLGAGKTTLIQKLLGEALQDTKVVLIENEFGEIGIDSGFLQEAGIEIREMNSGCICCSLSGDFKTALQDVLDTYTPERIIIEPSGVGKLSDVVQAVEAVEADISVNSKVTVVDVNKCKMYLKNFGEFFLNQVEAADTILLSRTGNVSSEKVQQAVDLLREYNAHAAIVTTPWEQLHGADILAEMEQQHDMEAELLHEVQHHHDHGHHHEHGEHCSCGHHHGEHNHHNHEHHHEHGETCSCGHHHGEHDHHHDHEHHHEHGEACSCGHHHADEVFVSWGMETPALYTVDQVETMLQALADEATYGTVLRAKGMVAGADNQWIYFDYVPGEAQVRIGAPAVTGKICVIGAGLQQDALAVLFGRA